MKMTTAKMLGSFHRELLEEGMPPDLVDSVVEDAAHSFVQVNGLVVKDGE